MKDLETNKHPFSMSNLLARASSAHQYPRHFDQSKLSLATWFPLTLTNNLLTQVSHRLTCISEEDPQQFSFNGQFNQVEIQ